MDDDQEVESSRISSPEDHNRQNDAEINGNHEDQDGYVVGLGRQTSIYSLTLDEFQHTICDQSGKSFGSMNMDEFLNSIWIAEENQNQQQQAQANDPDPIFISSGSGSGSSRSPKGGDKETSVIEKQPSFCLSRQGSLSLSIPAPLSRKTVDEVWTQIQQEEEQEQQQLMGGSAQRQPTFGELTLEAFLVKAGIVREQDQQNCGTITPQTPAAMVPPQQHHTQFGSAPQLGPGPSPSPSLSPAFGGRPIMPAYQQAAPATGVGSPCAKRNIGCPTVLRSNDGQPVGPRDGVRTGAGAGVGVGAVLSPVSPRPAGRMEVGAVRIGRKRTMDGPVEKVVERRQRRMIKNRESAARSRARKQAYTVELEAELNQLREENAKMKHILVEMKKKRKQQNVEQKLGTHRKGSMDQRGLRNVRRSTSCNL